MFSFLLIKSNSVVIFITNPFGLELYISNMYVCMCVYIFVSDVFYYIIKPTKKDSLLENHIFQVGSHLIPLAVV